MSKPETQDIYKINEFKISYQNKIPPHERVSVNRSSKAYQILRESWDNTKIEMLEQFKILLLDRKSNCLGISEICSGGWDYCEPDRRIIFSTALKARASSIILAHNHPSGSNEPSDQDIILTKKLKEAGNILKIPVVDHIIVNKNSYYSMGDEGLMP